MAAYILHRMVWTVVVMAMVGIFVFLLLRLAAGDPAAILAGDSATPQMIEGIRESLDSMTLSQFSSCIGRWASSAAISGRQFLPGGLCSNSSPSGWNRPFP